MFDNALKETMKIKENAGAPASMRSLEYVEIGKLKGKTIEITECIVEQKDRYNKDGSLMLRKDGSKLYKTVVFVAFGDKYTVTSSGLLVGQMGQIAGIDFLSTDKGTYNIPISGVKATIEMEKVRYADGKDYDNAVMRDA